MNMRPRIFGLYSAHDGYANVVFSGYEFVRAWIFENCHCVSVRKSGRPMFRAKLIASLAKAISDVIRARSDRKVIWIYARRIVARVQHYQSARNLSLVKFIRETVRPDWFLPWHEKYPVSVVIGIPSPYPTSVGFPDAVKKHIIGTKLSECGKRAGFSEGVVMTPAKASCHRYGTTGHAQRFNLWLIRHTSSICRYDGVCNYAL
jgi:hypothetical protein